MNRLVHPGWRKAALGEFFRLKHGFAFKSRFFAPAGDYLVLTPGNFEPDGGIKLRGDRDRYYSIDFPREYLLSPGDLVVVMTDLTQECRILGSPGFVPNRGRYLHNQRLGKVEQLRSDVMDIRYLYCLFNTTDVRSRLRGSATGTTVRHTSPDRIYAVEVLIPPLETQRRIALILSAYDDLIENNTRRIAILEEMARRLYEEWFVHFRFPGHENIPMIQSVIGSVPEGWSLQTVGSILEDHIGGGWGKEDPDGSYTTPAFVIRGTDIPAARMTDIGRCPFRFHNPSNFIARKLAPSDIVFEVSGGSHDQSVGRALFVTEQLISAFSGNVLCASFCKRLRVRKDALEPRLFYLHLQRIYASGHINQFQTQSTGIKNFQFKAFLEKEVLAIPPMAIQAQFSQWLAPIFDLTQTLGRKNANLRAQRDLLLPKLISGEIDVSELESPEADAEAA